MFNFIDIAIFLLVIYLIWQGWRTGLIGGILNLITTVVSIASATIFYPQFGGILADVFSWGENLSQVIAFFSILIFLEIVLSVAVNKIYSRFSPLYRKVEAFRYADKVLGIVPSIIVGLFLVSLFLLLPLILPVQASLRDPIINSWWGKNVLPQGLKYQSTVENYLNRLPYQNLVYLVTPEPSSRNSNFAMKSQLRGITRHPEETFSLLQRPAQEYKKLLANNRQRRAQTPL